MQDQPAMYRSTLALHIPQEQIPVGSASAESSKFLSVPGPGPQASTSTGSGSGYGPPDSTSPTPLQRLAQQHLTEDSDFELLCTPLSNGSWRQRFERMCIAIPGPPTSESRAMFDTRGDLTSDGGYNDEENAELAANVREAEVWRLSGCFKRGEVNATRSGTASQTFFSCRA
jgi:hypothetical protein